MAIKTFDSARSLETFGIYPLTGEACGINMRVLCDLSKDGQDIIREFLRVEPNSEPWNSETDGNGHVASVMLPVSILKDLWVFCQVRRGAAYVFEGGYVNTDQWTETRYESIDEVHRHPVKDWNAQAWAVDDHEKMDQLKNLECFYIRRTYTMSKAPGTGLDNQHGMSGRTK